MRPQADRILVATISGETKHHAKRRELTADEEAAAVAALRELAGGRADLLAGVCGVMEGASEGELHEPLARQTAELCRKAGADPEAIPRWIAEGRKRRDAAEAGQQRLNRYKHDGMGTSVSWPTWHLRFRRSRRRNSPFCSLPAVEEYRRRKTP